MKIHQVTVTAKKTYTPVVFSKLLDQTRAMRAVMSRALNIMFENGEITL